MPDDIDPISGRPTSQLEYGDWKYSESHSTIPDEPKYRYTTVYRERDVYVIEKEGRRKTYTQREQYGETKKQLTGTARKAAVARYEHKAAQKAVSLYEQAADPSLSLEERHVLAREAKYHADVGSDYLVEAKPGMPTSDKIIPVVDPRLLKEERHWRYYKEVPERFKERVAVPEDVKRLGLESRFLQESYAVSMGYKTEQAASREWQETYRQVYYEKYPQVEPVVSKPTAYEIEQEAIRQRWSGEKGLGEQVLEFGRFWASGLTSPENILYHKTIAEIFTGPEEGKKERILQDYTFSIMGLEAARKKGEGFFGETFEVFKESYKPGGFGFTGTIAAVVPTAFKGLGLLKGPGGVILAKGIPVAVIGGIGTVAGTDIGYTYATEEPIVGHKKVFGYGTHFAVAIGAGYLATRGPMPVVSKSIDAQIIGGLRQVPGYLQAKHDIGMWYKQAKFHTVQKFYRSPYVKDLQALGRRYTDWKFQRVKLHGMEYETGYSVRGFPRPGLYKPSEIKSVYPSYDVGRWKDPLSGWYTKIIGKQVFLRKMPAEVPGKGMWLTYKQQAEAHLMYYEPFKLTPHPKIWAKTVDIGRGAYFHPEAPGWYNIMGKQVFIGKLQAYDIYAGRHFAPGKLPKKVIQTGKIELMPDFKIIKPAFTFKPSGEFYKYVSFGKTQFQPGITRYTGLGRTTELYKITGKFKGYSMEVSKFTVVGEARSIYGGRATPFIGRGTIYDLTSWFRTAGGKVDTASGILQQSFQNLTKTLSLKVGIPSKPFVKPVSIAKGVVMPTGVTTAQVTKLGMPVVSIVQSISKTVVKPVSKIVVKPITKIISKPITKIVVEPVIKSIIKSVTKPVTKSITKPVIKSVTKPVTKSILEPVVKPVTKSITKQITKPILKPIITPIIKSAVIAPPEIVPPPVEPVPPKPIIFDLPDRIKKIMGLEQQAYNVKVKDRYIYHGKKTKKERFSRVNKQPLSKQDALSLGGHLVDQSAAASFKIEPTGGNPQPLKLYVGRWSNIGNKFYQKPKSKIHIERTAYRIDSQGEREGITALGLLARMEKAQGIRRVKPKKPKKAVREKAVSKQELKTAVDPFVDVEREINKMIKQVTKTVKGGF